MGREISVREEFRELFLFDVGLAGGERLEDLFGGVSHFLEVVGEPDHELLDDRGLAGLLVLLLGDFVEVEDFEPLGVADRPGGVFVGYVGYPGGLSLAESEPGVSEEVFEIIEWDLFSSGGICSSPETFWGESDEAAALEKVLKKFGSKI